MTHRSTPLLRGLVLVLTIMAGLLAPEALAQELATPPSLAPPQALLPPPPVREALIPTATLVLMPGTGHFAPFEQPEAFTQIVLAFLRAAA